MPKDWTKLDAFAVVESERLRLPEMTSCSIEVLVPSVAPGKMRISASPFVSSVARSAKNLVVA